MRNARGANGKRSLTRTLCALVCLAALLSLGIPVYAEGMEIGTTVSIRLEDSLHIGSQTEDCTVSAGADQLLMVTASGGSAPYTFVWRCSADGGASWYTPAGAGNAATYGITNAQPNAPAQTPYIYRVAVTDAGGATASADLRVLVSNDYAYRTITLRGGDVDVSSYMHDETRLVITPLSDEQSAAVQTLEAQLSPGCLPLLLCDVSLVNQNNEVVPYFGAVELEFHVGPQYNGQTLKAFHLHGGSVVTYSGVVADGILSLTVNALSPFLVEAAVAVNNIHTVSAAAGAGGGISPAGSVNVANGASKTFTFLPDAGYAVDTVRVDGRPVAVTGNSYTLAGIAADTAVSVSFRAVAPSDTTHTLTVTSGANGTVSPAGTVQLRHGAAQTFYFYPASGYELDTLVINGASVNVLGNSYTVSAVEGNTTVAASFRAAATQPPNVYKTITASCGAGGGISPAGDVRVEYGGGMYFYFIPNSGYTLDKVLVDGVETAVTGNRYQFINVLAPHTIHATFKLVTPPDPPTPYHTITAGAGANGSVTPVGSVSVAEGGGQLFIFVPYPGYSVHKVFVDGVETAVSGNSYRFSDVRADHTFHVTFRRSYTPPVTYYSIFASSGEHGRISPAGNVYVASGGTQTFYLLADEGYELDTLTVDGKAVAVDGNTYRFAGVWAGHSIHATYRKSAAPVTYHTITATAGDGGAVSPAGSVSVAAGGSVEFFLTPDEGYEVAELLVDGAAVTAAGDTYLFENVSAAHSLQVSFRKAKAADEEFFTLVTQAGEHGSISPAGELQVAAGGSQTLYFIPDEGYEVEAIYLNGEKLELVASQYTAEKLDGDWELRVSFRPVGAASAGGDCHCLWARLLGSCALCALLGRCLAPWCFLIPLLLLAAAGGAVWLVLRKNWNKKA